MQGLPASPAADIFAFGKLGQQLLSSRDKPSGSEAAPAGMLTGLQLLLEACCSTDATSRPSATYLESHLRCILQPTHQGDCQNGIPTEPSPFALTDLRQEQPVGQVSHPFQHFAVVNRVHLSGRLLLCCRNESAIDSSSFLSGYCTVRCKLRDPDHDARDKPACKHA